MVKLFALVLFAALATETFGAFIPGFPNLFNLNQPKPVQVAPPPTPTKNQNIFEDYSEIMRYIPQQLGVQYNDEADKDLTTVGNTLLGYGIINQGTRRSDFRRLKEQLNMGIQARRLYIQALDRETGLLKSVVDAINANIKTIQSRSATVVEEIDSAANENAF